MPSILADGGGISPFGVRSVRPFSRRYFLFIVSAMRVISTTMCYPTAASPTQGVFVWRRLREIHRLMPVRVIAPAPWFPLWRTGNDGGSRPLPYGRGSDQEDGPLPYGRGSDQGFDQESGSDQLADPPASRPRMFYFPGVLKRLDAWFYARAVSRELRNRWLLERPAIVDAHFEWPDGVGGWWAARQFGLPFVCTLRGKLVSQIREAAKRRRIREMLLGADGLIAVSRSLAKLACDVAGRDLGVHVIPNGIDGGVFRRMPAAAGSPSAEARAACGWAADAKYVVSVGHLQAIKGFDRLVDAWPEVRGWAGDARLILVGGSAGEPAYERTLRASIERTGGLGVEFAGRLRPERVAAMLNAADLFVLASRSEGWCNAIAEALACGCPVVATDVGGNQELVNEPVFGRLVPLGDSAALVEGIRVALASTWDRQRIAAEKGRRTWQQVARECVDVFEEVLRRRGRQVEGP